MSGDELVQDIFALNFNAKPRVEIASNSVPVLYIDDFYKYPLKVREYALSKDYASAKAFYPGRHAPLEEVNAPGIDKVIEYIRKIVEISTTQNIPKGSIETDFSILTIGSADLTKAQGHPHIDETPLLALVYLNEKDLGGTKFYHNKVLNKSIIKTAEERNDLSLMLERSGKDIKGYVTGENELWKPVYTIEGKFNRLVCYPGNVFHSITVKQEPSSENICSQRLTQRIIFNAIEI